MEKKPPNGHNPPNDKTSSVAVDMIDNEGNVVIEIVVVLCVCGM